MAMLDFFGNAVCNFMIYCSFFIFIVFLAFMRIMNMAAGKTCHAKLNKANFYFLLAYIAIGLTCLCRSFSWHLAAAFAGGIFLFITLQQIYFMALVGLAKKSVSVTIVEAAEDSNGIEENKLTEKFSGNADAVRLNRLEQMKFLGLATEQKGKYIITGRGKFFNALGNIILKIWGLERL